MNKREIKLKFEIKGLKQKLAHKESILSRYVDIMDDQSREIVTLKSQIKHGQHPNRKKAIFEVCKAMDLILILSPHLSSKGVKYLRPWLADRGITERVLTNIYAPSRSLDIAFRAGEYYCSRYDDREVDMPVYGIAENIFDSICALHLELISSKKNTFTKIRFT